MICVAVVGSAYFLTAAFQTVLGQVGLRPVSHELCFLSAKFACSDGSYKCLMYSSTFPPSFWFLLWKLALSWVTFLLGSKYCRTYLALY